MGHSARRDTIGPYRILGKLASGGMATVHVGRARDATSGGWVAIKRLHSEFAGEPAAMRMLLDEARFTASVVHVNVVPTIDVLECGDELFLVMEYIHGQSLSWLLKRAARTSERIP